MSEALEQASTLAGKVYARFMQQVIEKYVLHDRCDQRLYARNNAQDKKTAQKKSKGQEADIRFLYLLSISGKGGWTNNPKKQASYLKNANISLLDHLLSVTRGALMLAAMDLLLQNKHMDLAFLERRLNVIAVIAFLHDLDKMEQLPRNQALSIALVEQALDAYGLTDFLTEPLSAEQVRFLIEHAEDSQAHRHPPAQLPPRDYENDIKNYVKLADKLDGIWHQYGADGGLQHLMQRLQKEQSLHSNLLNQWQALELFDPHHPFLLDELQRELSFICLRSANIPPLLELHQGGRLFMLLPKESAEAIKTEALQRFCERLPFSLYLNISTVGVPELINAQPDYVQYQRLIEDLKAIDLSKIFTMKRFLVPIITPFMDELLGDIGLKPQWSKGLGQTVSPYPNPDELKQFDTVKEHLNKAASLTLLLNLKLPNKKQVLNYAQRESALSCLVTAITKQTVPEWISVIEAKARQSRCTLLALWATALASSSAQLAAAIWGDKGILQQWLDGTEAQQGLRTFIEDKGAYIVEEVKQHFQHLMTNKYLSGIKKGKGVGHCLFTDRPTRTLIADKMKLHGVKVSAFAGREGRSETVIASPKGSVHIGNVSLAEYKLRQNAFEVQGGKNTGVPSLISSPMTTGLFSALILNNEASFQALSVYDLARKKRVKGKVIYRGLEAYNRRYRMARFETMPVKLIDQMSTLRLLLSACLRIGRPIHVFRGLPTYQKAFFYYDAMPPVLRQLLGFNQFRIEQIPTAILQLQFGYELIDTNGLGHDIFKYYANPKTRLSAVCLAYCHLRDRETGTYKLRNQLLSDYLNVKESNMTLQEGALVRLGTHAARLQRSPRKQASTNEETLVFSFSLNTAIKLKAVNQADKASLIYGIAAELETNLVRKDKACAKKYRDGVSLRDECIRFATFFVESVWFAVLKQRPPSQTTRRLLSSVYRMAFLQASKEKYAITAE
jgi:hypothetical protein